ncbi:pirin family protein [Flavihumibacter profundi]|jgi:quercetin 2,3-dioxygenase|uniref:pirin family protein n=1 Tax=Flavihumibacter profundi TaxID=2716883 RepID=UPI001CC75C2F|nr:pirin family protein [Flavihumibacter profundi]MBZ5858526.1 pirin family protein [Flavihumibacter profundi]
MKTIFHPSAERGAVDFGWLNSHHSFSFGHWYNPEKVHFGALRVLNDDIVRGGAGFGTHPHDNMEIVSIPLKGALAHKDSTGTDGVINTGDVQIMSAGSGIQHSEYNASKTDQVNFLQIWVYPKVQNIKPRYEQKAFNESGRQNQWQVVVSPDVADGGVWINQDSLFSLATVEAGKTISYTNRFKGNGVYFFLLEGSIEIAGQKLSDRDAIGVWEAEETSISVAANSKILAIEIPMIGEA